MKKADMVFIDGDGKAWLTGEGIAKLWKERAEKEYRIKDARYTRWAARNRVNSSGDLAHIDTEDGRLYSKEDAMKVELRPRSTPRNDVAERNRANKPFSRKSEFSESTQSSQ